MAKRLVITPEEMEVMSPAERDKAPAAVTSHGLSSSDAGDADEERDQIVTLLCESRFSDLALARCITAPRRGHVFDPR